MVRMICDMGKVMFNIHTMWCKVNLLRDKRKIFVGKFAKKLTWVYRPNTGVYSVKKPSLSELKILSLL